MKTPDEIKKALECCFQNSEQCVDCPYYPATCDRELVRDAREYIRQLEADNDRLTDEVCNAYNIQNEQHERIQELEAERDALMHYLHSMGCDTCLFDDYDGSEPPCINCTSTRDLWQFQGVQKEE